MLAVSTPARSMEMTVPNEVPAYTSAAITLRSEGGAHFDSRTCIDGNVTPCEPIRVPDNFTTADYTHMDYIYSKCS
jgi:hypothetical protein